MRRFLKDLTLFLFPLVLFLMPGFIVLHAAGEFASARSVGRLSRSSRTMLAGNAYTNYFLEWKMHETKARRPKVLALGTSRVGQFRSRFFKDPGVFFNAAVGGISFDSYRHFIEELGAPSPDIIIIDMLQPFFGPPNPRFPVVSPNVLNSDRGGESFEDSGWSKLYDDSIDRLQTIMGTFFRDGAWWRVYSDYAVGKFTLGDVFKTRDPRVALVGLRALTTSDGATNDGSDHYGKIIASRQERERVRSEIAKMVAGVNDEAAAYGYDYGPEISPDAIEVLKEFLRSCKDRNIFVIGFLPPMPHAVYEAMQAHPKATYAESFRMLPATLRKIYSAYGFDFYDFEDPVAFGGSDSEMVNETHGSEKMYLRLFIKMAETSRPLASFVDLPWLRAALESTEGEYEVFPLLPF